MQSFDLAFIGFGVAAMSLLVRLEPSFKGRIAIIEPRDLPRNDQTWCGWPLTKHIFSEYATRRWHRWAVSHNDMEIVRTGMIPYEMFSSRTIQIASLAAVQRRVDWRLFGGSSLKQATFTNKRWVLELDCGRTIRADYVLDARPPSVHVQRPWLWQSFVGREIIGKFDSDPETVRLMDFIPGKKALVTFIYELPLATNHRLIEITQFTPEPADVHKIGRAHV